MRGRSKLAALAILLTVGWPLTQAQSPAAPIRQQADHGAILVELFTSEGCSSCPPADAVLRDLDGTYVQTGKRIVVISEHVTYWNSLGWADPFSAEIYTQRQADYADKLRLESSYTPQMVIGGTEQVVGSDRAGVDQAIRKVGRQDSQVSIHIVEAKPSGDRLQISFTTSGDTEGADIVAVLTDDRDSSSVQRGENSGHTLAHVSVARSFTRIGKAQASGEQSASVPLPANLRGTPGHHLILFLQKAKQGRVMGADTRPLG